MLYATLTFFALSAQIAAPKAWPGAEPRFQEDAKAAIRAATQGDATSLGRLYRLKNTAALVRREQRLRSTLDAIISARRTPALTSAHAEYLRSQLDPALDNDIGLVRDLWVLGPFDNPAGLGHRTKNGPENNAAIDTAQKYGNQDELAWRYRGADSGFTERGVIRISEMVGTQTSGTVYVAFGVQAPNAARAVLRIGATDSVSAWIGGAQVLDMERRGEAALDQQNIPFELEAGGTTFLLKLSFNTAPARALVRLTDPSGRRLRDIQITRDLESPRPQRGEKRPEWSITTPLSGLSGPSSDELALRSDVVALLSLYDGRKRPSRAGDLAHKALQRAPNDPDRHFFYALRVRGDDPTASTSALHRATAIDPCHVPSHLRLAIIAQRRGIATVQRKHLDQAIACDATFLSAQIARAELLADNPYQLHRAARELAAAPGVRHSAEALLKLAELRTQIDDHDGAGLAIQRALALRPRALAANGAALSRALMLSDIESIRALLQSAVVQEPWHLEHHLALSRFLLNNGRVDEGLRTLHATQEAFPTRSEIWTALGDARLGLSDVHGAREAFSKSLDLNPVQPRLRERLAHWAQQTETGTESFFVDTAQALRLPVNDVERERGAAFLLDRAQVRFEETGQSTRVEQKLIRISKAEVGHGLRVQRFPYAPSREHLEIIEASLLRADGSTEGPIRVLDRGRHQKTEGMYLDLRTKEIIFESPREGDSIHIQLRVNSTGENIFGGFFGSVFPLQSAFPKHNVLVRAIAPTARPLYNASIRVPQPKVTTHERWQTTTWSLDRLEPITNEPNMPAYTDLAQYVSVSSYKGWQDLGRWYASLYGEQVELDAAGLEAARRLKEQATSPEDLVRRTHNYVLTTTRYVGIELGIHGWKPFKASEVHRRRYGDCKDKATLLVALLRANGIDASIALVRTRDRGGFPEDHPTMWAFNHAITYVPQWDLYLDGTAEFSGSAELPHLDQGALALVVHTDGAVQLTHPPLSRPAENRRSSTFRAKIDVESGALEVRGKERFFGGLAPGVRQRFQEPETRIPTLQRRLGTTINGTELLSAEFEGLKDREATPAYTAAFRVANHARRDAGALRLPVGLRSLGLAASLAQLPQRTHPVSISMPRTYESTVHYELPSNARAKTLPAAVHIAGPHVTFTLEVKPTPTGYEVNERLSLRSIRVPLAEYPEFRRNCLAIDRARLDDVVIEVGS